MSHEVVKYESSLVQQVSNTIALTHKLLLAAEADRYYSMALSSRDSEDYTRAMKYIFKAIELNPNFFNAHLELIALCLYENEIESALLHLEEALDKFPNNAALFLSRGRIKAELLGNHNAAIEDFTMAIELERNLPVQTKAFHEAFLDRAQSKGEIGDEAGKVRDDIVYKIRRYLYERNYPEQ